MESSKQYNYKRLIRTNLILSCAIVLALLISSVRSVAQNTVPNSEWSYNEKLMLNEVNLLRTNPEEYIAYIHSFVNERKSESNRKAKQYKRLANGLVKDIRKHSNRPKFIADQYYYSYAKKWGNELEKGKIFKHDPNLEEGQIELLSCCYDNIRDNLILLILDPGPKNWLQGRGHRKAILEDKLLKIGISEVSKYKEDRDPVFVFRIEYFLQTQ